MVHAVSGVAAVLLVIQQSAVTHAPAEEKEAWVKVVEERQGYGPPETGGNWVEVARDDTTSIYFIDRSSIRKKGRFFTAWEKQDHRADPEVGSREALALHLYDCDAGSAAMMEVHVYRHDGSKDGIIFTEPEKALKPVKEGTIGLPLLAYVCIEGGWTGR